ncbi:hypothetical protein H4S02_000957, partial [Coemansia sp. RSA 2611]
MQALIYKVFTRKYSLSLQADALQLLSEAIAQNELTAAQAAQWLELLADTWTKREEGRPLVEAGPLRELVAAITAGSDHEAAALAAGGPGQAAGDTADVFTVISAFDVPALWYDPG